MSFSGQVAVVGVHEWPSRSALGIHPFQIHAECISRALDDAGLELADVDGFCTAAGDRGEGGAYMDLTDVLDYLGIEPRYYDSTDAGGTSAVSQTARAVTAIASGEATVVVVSSVACPRSFPIKALFWDGLTHPAGMGQFELPYSPTVVSSYALAAQRHMHDTRLTSEHLARIAVTCRANAVDNPDARFREPISVDDVLSSPMIASPLHLLDCCPINDGGGALVLAAAERAASLRKPPALILGFGDDVGGLSLSRLPHVLGARPGARAATRAFEMAGMRVEDVDVAQIYDGFTIMVALFLEELGFCERGEAADFIDSGAIDPGGPLAINTDGGGLSSNQNGRRGIFLLIEAVRQLRGESPGRQVAGARTAVAHAVGGFFSSRSTMILGLS